ncbi:hypothetical protein RYX36_033287 [Vicia faba]
MSATGYYIEPLLDKCKVFATCGERGVCVFNASGSAECRCPFKIIETNKCLVSNKQDCGSLTEMKIYKNLYLYGTYPLDDLIVTSSLQQCEQLCQNDSEAYSCNLFEHRTSFLRPTDRNQHPNSCTSSTSSPRRHRPSISDNHRAAAASPNGPLQYPTNGLEPHMIHRYSRHLVLPSFGVQGQANLLKSSILVVGAGGLAAGFGKLGVLDHDKVELNNMHRQIIHTEAYIGQPKVKFAAAACRLINSSIEVVEHEEVSKNSNALEIFSKYDIIVDATDNAPTRYLINNCCVVLRKPLVSGAAVGLEGQLTIYNHNGGPCFRCLFPTSTASPNPLKMQEAELTFAIMISSICSLRDRTTISVLSNYPQIISQSFP